MSELESLRSEFEGTQVIITGASGFIGLHLAQALSALDAKVLIIDRAQPSDQLPHAEFEWADLRHLDKTYETDYLIHLAAITNAGYAERFPLDTYEVNVLGTVNLLNHVNVKRRVLFPSTALMYKESSEPLAEDAEAGLESTYAQSKFIGEQVVKFACERMKVDYTIVRFFNIYGPGQLPMYIVPQVFRQILEDRRIVLRNGSVLRDLLYVDDCLDAVAKLVVSPAAENSTFNIGSGETVSIHDIAQGAIDASDEHEVEITDLQQGIQYSPTSIMADTTKVRSTIDWSPQVKLEEGLRRVWETHLNAKSR